MNFKLRNEIERKAVIAYIQDLDILKVKFTITISRIRDKRSIDQNRLYWLWIACICKDTGNDKDDVHQYLREYFLGLSDKEIFGVKIQKSKSTTELDTKQFTDYLEKIKIWAARELGIALPLPSDLYFQAFYEEFKKITYNRLRAQIQ